jgi:hypothetical protein
MVNGYLAVFMLKVLTISSRAGEEESDSHKDLRQRQTISRTKSGNKAVSTP